MKLARSSHSVTVLETPETLHVVACNSLASGTKIVGGHAALTEDVVKSIPKIIDVEILSIA